jgi:tripartite-type tricarboxylate transporter receptor subunit TctC
MKSVRIVIMLTVFVLAMVFAGQGIVQAADYPIKPVTIVVGFPPGGPADLTARALVKAVEPFFPQPMTVVNKPGGGSVLATNEVSHAKPDGYLLGSILNTTVTVSPHLSLSIPYKGPDDVFPIIHYLGQSILFVVHADSPFKTMNEVVKYAKANPGKLRIGHSGIGTSTHIHLESLIREAGVPLTHVPFEGASPVMTALLGKHTDGLLLNQLPTLPHVKAGKFRYLALFADERIKVVPELAIVPTMKELGYKVLADGTDFFIGAPNKTPKEITDMLFNALLKAEKTDFYQNFCKDNVVSLSYAGTENIRKDWNEKFKMYKTFLPSIGLKPSK